MKCAVEIRRCISDDRIRYVTLLRFTDERSFVSIGDTSSDSRLLGPCVVSATNDYSMLIEFFLVAFLPSGIFGFGKTVYVGGLFEEDTLNGGAFRISINSLNRDRHGNDELPDQYLQAEPISTINNDSYDMARTVCDLTNKGVAAIFGPQNGITSRPVQSMCDTMEIPHIVTAWDSELMGGNGLVNFYPYSRTLSTVYLQLALAYKWLSFTILYEDTDNLIRMKQLLERWDRKGHTVTLRQLPRREQNYRPILKGVRNSGELNIVLDCSIDILPEVLMQAQQVGLMSHKHNYIIASLDLQIIDLEPYQYGDTNFTGLRLVDPEDPFVVEVFENNKLEWNLKNPSQLTVEAALVYDSVQLFGRALRQLDDAIKADVKTSLCDNRDSWEHGSSLMNFMRLTEIRGLTGLIKFDSAGYRSNFKLDIISLNAKGVNKIGEWNTTRGVQFLPQENHADLDFQNKTFVVLISLTAPYGMLKESAHMETGNGRYEGFGVDIIQELANIRGFNFTFQEQSDYGSKDPVTKRWSGMLGKIMNNQADLAITDLTITADRQDVVDFTMPFMNLGISILFTKPRPAGSNFFSFLLPYSSEVWVWLIVSYLLSSLLLFMVGRLCPDEWNNPYPCIEEPEVLENQLSFKNSLWFNLGAFMQQGSEIAPIGLSTRMMASAWWFFCLIIVQSYTANLAACLVIESDQVLIKNVEDLLNNPHGIKYGAKKSGSTIDYFRQMTTHPTYSKIYQRMMENADEVLVESNDAGVEKVLEDDGKYAFFMESATIAYVAERKCNLQQVGPLIDNKGYGIAMKKHSPYRQSLSTALLTLQESGVLEELRTKWWSQKRGGGNCAAKKETSDAESLGTENVGGVFAVLVVGVALSCLYTALELLCRVRSVSIKEHVAFTEEIKEELKFIVKCNGTVKPVRRRDGRSASNRSLEENSENSMRGCTPPNGFIPRVITTTTRGQKATILSVER